MLEEYDSTITYIKESGNGAVGALSRIPLIDSNIV